MKIGYARVSTDEQNLDAQIDALKSAGCEKIFTDKISGVSDERKGFEELMQFIRPDDTLVVWRLDRLGRTLKKLILMVEELQNKKISFVSLKESIDTSSSGGRLIFHVFGALAEFERELIRERTKAGLEAAKARGRLGGRPRAMNDEKVRVAKALMQAKTPIGEICRSLGVSKCTLYRSLN